MHDRLGWKWVYPVHEYLVRASDDDYIERYPSNEHVLECDMSIVGLEHHPDRIKSRAQYKNLLKMRLEESPNKDYQAMYYLGNEYLASGEVDKAEVLFKDIEANDPAVLDVLGARMILGDIYNAKGDEDNAFLWYQKAIFELNSSS